jgi:thiol-disulfide isomerase/thioredoxin
MTKALGAALLAGALLLAGGARAGEARIGEAVGLPRLSAVGGGAIDTAALRGKVVVLAWFASYCPYCMLEAPRLQKLYRENGDRLAVIGVNIEDGDPHQADKVRAWVARYGWTFPVTGDHAALRRVLGKLKGLPVVQVIDRQGVLRQVEVGEMLDEDFDDIAAFARKD